MKVFIGLVDQSRGIIQAEILGSRGVNLAFFFAFHRYFVRYSVAVSIRKE